MEKIVGRRDEDMELLETTSDVTKSTIKAAETTTAEEGEEESMNPQLLSARELLEEQRREWKKFVADAIIRGKEREREKKEAAELERARRREIKMREREERKRQKGIGKKGGGGR